VSDDWTGEARDGASDAGRLAGLATAANTLRRRITSPESFPQPFPQEFALLALSRLLDGIADAGSTPTAAAWQRVVEAEAVLGANRRQLVQAGRHRRRFGPGDHDRRV
jgi:hypothetical protein